MLFKVAVGVLKSYGCAGKSRYLRTVVSICCRLWWGFWDLDTLILSSREPHTKDWNSLAAVKCAYPWEMCVHSATVGGFSKTGFSGQAFTAWI